MAKEYKKVSCYALALILLSLRDYEFFSFSASPFDLGLNFRLGRTSLIGESYGMVFAPSCSDTAFLWDEEAVEDIPQVSESLLSYLLEQKYPEDRPDDDHMLYVKEEDWSGFIKAHPELSFSDGDVRDVTDEELEKF